MPTTTNKYSGRSRGNIVNPQLKNKRNIQSASRRKKTNYAKTPQEMKEFLLHKKRSDYASAAMQDEVLSALYTSHSCRYYPPHKLAFKDAANAPEILSIDTTDYLGDRGNKIIIEAIDDFMVKEVRVDIFDGTGKYIESGYATGQEDHYYWTYIVKEINLCLSGTTISVHACDHPRNYTSLEITL